MQDENWDHLRIFLAVARAGSFAAAGRALGCHETTVARQIAAFEARSGRQLLARNGNFIALTGEGRRVVATLAPVEAAMATARLSRGARARGDARGRLSLTAVPWMVSRILLPAVPDLCARHPDLSLDVTSHAAALSPMRGDTDIALRFARPRAPLAALTRRLATVPFGLFARPGAPDDLIGYVGDAAHLPQARWGEPATPRHRVSDLDGALTAVRAGLGYAWLPLCLADDGLRRLSPQRRQRELWIVTHPALRGDGRLRAVARWLDRRVAPRLGRAVPAS